MSAPSNPEHAAGGSHYQPSTPVVVLILIAFILAAILMLRSPSSSSGSSAVAPTTPGSPTTTLHTTTTTLPRAQVRVQVANGTNVSGLARTFTQQLLTQGWDTLPQLNGPHVSATVIYFNPGFQWAARAIASAERFPSSSVRPLNGQNPVPGAASDDVVMVLGPDAAALG